MQSFNFRLATVLRVRDMQLRAEESSLETLLAERVRIEQQRDHLERQLAESWQVSKAQSTLQGADLLAMRSLSESAKRQRTAFATRLAAQDSLIDKQRSIVVEARRQVRLLEKLKEKREAEWQAEADREMAALADDVTNAKWSRIGQ